MITITLESGPLRREIARLGRRLGDLTPVMQDIGELLVESTRRRFATSTAPDGRRWAPNRPSTLERYLARYKGSYTKAGRLSARGTDRVLAKRPLIGESRRLSSEIFYRADATGVTIASGLRYAAVQQFGAQRGQFGQTARGAPIPWGRIPARPFLGLSAQDRTDLADTLAAWLAR